MSGYPGEISRRDVVVDTQLDYRPWVLAFLIGAVPAAAQEAPSSGEQSDDGPDLKIEVGDSVKIDRGMLGSYWLSAHSSVAIKVRRTQ
jgi:hypothetical protein